MSVRILLLAILATAITAVPGTSKGQEPKKDYFIGDGEVDLHSGLFMYSNIDIAIGGPESEGGLALVRHASVRPNSWSMGSTSGHSKELILYRKRYKPSGSQTAIYAYHYYVISGTKLYTFEQPEFSDIVNYPGDQHSLVKTGEDGPFLFTDKDGTVVEFPILAICEALMYQTYNCSHATRVSQSNGTVSDLHYDTITRHIVATAYHKRLRLVTTNRGFGLGFDYSDPNSNRIVKVCSINLAHNYASISAPCPPAIPAATYEYGGSAGNLWSTYTNQSGLSFHYGYSMYGISSIRRVGSTANDVTISYATFPASLNARVTSQTYADGKVLNYEYYNGPHPLADEYGLFEQSYNTWTKTVYPDSSETLFTFPSGVETRPYEITDRLGRVSRHNWGVLPYRIVPTKKTAPESNEVRYAYDTRGNLIETRSVAKPGSGLADIISSAVYPATCSSRVTCNQPTSTTEANGNVTSYTYDPVHGGVLTETGPSVGGVAPQKRHEYAQRYAWIKDSSGGYVQEATPVWVKVREEFCKTTAASGSGCTGGAADEVVTDYDYGPNSGPNNLLLRGVAVTADGQTLRTCYGYDKDARRISETRPLANLASCP